MFAGFVLSDHEIRYYICSLHQEPILKLVVLRSFQKVLPSGQPPLLGAGPLRTGLESFPSSGSSIQ
jgi:hypothetical protein